MMRIAIFFTPPPEHPLTRAASLWLGRDAFTGESFPPRPCGGMTTEEITVLTREPRRYGFHATLKPPFQLADGCRLQDVEDVLETVARSLPPVELGRLAVSEIGSFFALTPMAEGAAVNDLAAEVVRSFDVFRAPATAEEIARRRPERLSARQRDHLIAWGYPYVFDDFRFHMTLTGAIPAARRTEMRRVLQDRFRPLLDTPVAVDALALFVEPDPPGDFVVRKRVALCATRHPVVAS